MSLHQLSIGRGHMARINAEVPPGGRIALWDERTDQPGTTYDVVLVPADAPDDAIERAAARLSDHGVLFLHGAEQQRFDTAKLALVELGHMGPCDSVHPAQLWWGAARGWSTARPRSGPLPVIISYFTTATPYEDEARELVATCDMLGLEHRVVGVPARGSWEGNCAMKAGFMVDMWRDLRRPILWVDADARLRRAPDLLRGVTADLGVHKAARWQFASGTVLVNASELGGELLLAWRRRCEEDPRVWDQVHLDRAWEEVARRAPLETMWLPQSYCRIFDRPEDADGGGGVVVEHFQASRRHKSAVTIGPPRPFVDFDEALKAARRASRPIAC